MKLLMVTMAMDIGGAETHILELSRELMRRGISVTVASNGGAYERELAACGIRHVKIPCHTKNPIFMQRAYKLLEELILSERFDVVHAHARIPAFLCERLRKKLRFRFVTTAHGVFNPAFPYSIFTRWGERSLAVSEDVKEYLRVNYDLPEKNIRVTINGIDLDKFSPDTDYSDIERELELTAGAPRIVHVSRLDAEPSMVAFHLIELMPELDRRHSGVECVIVGGGSEAERVRAAADAMNARLGRRAVILAGRRTDINKFATAGDVFVGVSRAALEAMACTVPTVLAGAQGYIGIFDEPELSRSVETNFCCRGCGELTPTRLADDISAVLTMSRDERRRLGSYGRETVRRYYSVSAMADDALRLYISAVKHTDINRVDPAELDGIDGYLRFNPLSPKGKKYDVLFSGYYGFGNMGDDSILETVVEKLRESAPDIRIAALTKHPSTDSRRFGIRCIGRMNLIRAAYTMLRSRVLVSGGGSLFQDTTSSKSLKYYAFIVNLARLLGMRVYIYANGVGVIRYNGNRALTARTVRRANAVTVRDRASLDELVSIGVPADTVSLSADPAFMMGSLPEHEIEELRRRWGLADGEEYFAVSLRRFDGVQKNAYSESELLSSVCSACAECSSRHGLKPVFVAMQPGLDLELSRLAHDRLLAEHGIESLVVAPASGRELLSVLRGTDTLTGARFVCAMRLHILIYACNAAIPVIGLSLDPKIDALLESFDYSSLIDVPSLTSEKLSHEMERTVSEYDTHTDELVGEAEKFKSLALGDIDGVFKLLSK